MRMNEFDQAKESQEFDPAFLHDEGVLSFFYDDACFLFSLKVP